MKIWLNNKEILEWALEKKFAVQFPDLYKSNLTPKKGLENYAKLLADRAIAGKKNAHFLAREVNIGKAYIGMIPFDEKTNNDIFQKFYLSEAVRDKTKRNIRALKGIDKALEKYNPSFLESDRLKRKYIKEGGDSKFGNIKKWYLTQLFDKDLLKYNSEAVLKEMNKQIKQLRTAEKEIEKHKKELEKAKRYKEAIKLKKALDRINKLHNVEIKKEKLTFEQIKKAYKKMKNFKKWAPGNKYAKDTILNSFATAVLNKSLFYCPIDTGNLRNSVRLNKVINRTYAGESSSGFMIRYNADYAFEVHEDSTKRHDFPTQSKFLEDAAMETISEYTAAYGPFYVPEVKIEYEPLTLYIDVDGAPGGVLHASEYVPENAQDYSVNMMSEMMNFTAKGLSTKFEQFEKFIDEEGNINMHEEDMAFKTDRATSEYFAWLALARYSNKM